jgi:sensor domain CHASE-containing protein
MVHWKLRLTFLAVLLVAIAAVGGFGTNILSSYW